MNEIPEILEDLKQGKMIILVDDENRENEGDLVMAAEFIDHQSMAFMIRFTGGVVCLSMTHERADDLQLPPMVPVNECKRKTAFTVSIEAASGVTTGISAVDRAITIEAAVFGTASDLVRPGHVYPLRAVSGGVLERNGHTEGSLDLCKLAGLKPMAVISELMHDHGVMMKGRALLDFADEYELKICSVQQIIDWLNENPLNLPCRNVEVIPSVVLVAESDLQTEFGDFLIKVFEDEDGKEHVVMQNGRIGDDTLVRIHSECLTGEVLHSLHCDCDAQLDKALEEIGKHGGVVVYLRQEGRGIGLSNKIRAYALQQDGLDTVEANEKLGFRDDERGYEVAAQILNQLGVETVRLFTNNPRKVKGLEKFGLKVVERKELKVRHLSDKSKEYLKVKELKLGHFL
jgi:3,4-dihydroxy 2-butanone 4-phosphate synthase / GTP cyclohydrolase II